MIVEAILDLLAWFSASLVSLIPSFELDITGAFSAVVELGGYAGSMSAWVPWQVIGYAFATTWSVRWGMATVSLLMKIYAMIRGGAS